MRRGYEVRLAQDAADLRAVQRLRYAVFGTELGGGGPTVDHAAGLERDGFDALADHLMLVDGSTQAVVGVYRLLPGDRLGPGQMFCSEAEYDLTPLRRCGRRLLELGRSCLHADHRGGTGMVHLWNGLADYIAASGAEVLFGVASFQGTDTARLAGALAYLHRHHLAPPELRVRSRRPVDLAQAAAVDRRAAMLATPALLKGYLRLGGFIGDGAFVDHALNTVDVCVVLEAARIPAHKRRLLDRGRQ